MLYEVEPIEYSLHLLPHYSAVAAVLYHDLCHSIILTTICYQIKIILSAWSILIVLLKELENLRCVVFAFWYIRVWSSCWIGSYGWHYIMGVKCAYKGIFALGFFAMNFFHKCSKQVICRTKTKMWFRISERDVNWSQ